jgi:uncharacterized protein YndB with AHSA1/START domain
MATVTHSATVTLKGDREIVITREFDAPRHLVYRACTEPDLVKRWWSGRRGEVTSAVNDLRVGGTWRWVMAAQGGIEVAFHGEYRELVPGERIVSTEVFEPMPDETGSLNTITLEELDGNRTKMSVQVLHQRPEHRDAHIGSGMEGGMQEAYDALEEVARSLR